MIFFATMDENVGTERQSLNTRIEDATTHRIVLRDEIKFSRKWNKNINTFVV